VNSLSLPSAFPGTFIVGSGSGRQSGKTRTTTQGDVFAPITQVAVNQLDESMRAMYRIGDNLQTRMCDMAFSWMNPTGLSKINNWNPFRSMANCDECSEDSNGASAEEEENGSKS